MVKKKTFSNDLESILNPAASFVTHEEPEPTPPPKEEPPEGCYKNPLFIEKKSRRLQLLIQPSLYELVKTKAEANKTSVNDIIHSILEAELKGE